MTTPFTFSGLKSFILETMQMSHVYQPVMLRVLLDRGGYASTDEIAKALLGHDPFQVECYKKRTKNMVGRILTNHGIVEPIKDGKRIVGYKLNADSLSKIEIATLKRFCDSRLNEFIEKRGDSVWRRRRDADSPKDEASSKDEASFRNALESRQEQEYTSNCLFCKINPDRVVAENELCYAIRDGFPVTPLHTLVVPKRHVANYFNLYQSELEAIHVMLDEQHADIPQQDKTVTGFNLGINAGSDAGQTIFHAHIHLIPRRYGDVSDPRGGVRGTIPSKQKY
ncbi:MAG: HIT family protein [Hyphomicrobiales bacterium]|nr:HIT family protein [Hyphomicrobiales bacterium]MCY4052471.1 HIT family protein [Hyphomicrobiales bacterium]